MYSNFLCIPFILLTPAFVSAKKTRVGSFAFTSSVRMRTAREDPNPQQFHAYILIWLGGAAQQQPPHHHQLSSLVKEFTTSFACLGCVWIAYFLPIYFIIQFIFATIHRPHYTFGTIYGSYCTISVNFYLYLQYFQQKVFSFSKINGSQTYPQCVFGSSLKSQFILLFSLFLLLFIGSTALFILFIGLIILFQLTFTFIYSTGLFEICLFC